MAWKKILFPTLNLYVTWHGSNSANFCLILAIFSNFKILESFLKMAKFDLFFYCNILALKTEFKTNTKSNYPYLTVAFKIFQCDWLFGVFYKKISTFFVSSWKCLDSNFKKCFLTLIKFKGHLFILTFRVLRSSSWKKR